MENQMIEPMDESLENRNQEQTNQTNEQENYAFEWYYSFCEKTTQVCAALQTLRNKHEHSKQEFAKLFEYVISLGEKPPRHLIHFCYNVRRRHNENNYKLIEYELEQEENRITQLIQNIDRMMNDAMEMYKNDIYEIMLVRAQTDVPVAVDPVETLIEKLKTLYSNFLMEIRECPIDSNSRFSDYCEVCDQPLSFYQSEGCLCCPFCGTSRKYIDPAPVGGPAHVQDESASSNFTSSSNAKRNTQYRDWLLFLFQVKSPVEIPEEAIHTIMAKLIEIGITNGKEITIAEVRKVLKLTGGKAYYNHITQITCIILKLSYPKMATATEIKLVQMFAAIQDPYDRLLNGNRKDFPPPTLCTLFFAFLLDLPELPHWLPLLIDKSKRFEQIENLKKVAVMLNMPVFHQEKWQTMMDRFNSRTKTLNIRRRPTIRISKTALADLGPIKTGQNDKKSRRKSNKNQPNVDNAESADKTQTADQTITQS
jgi:hypothetical protein